MALNSWERDTYAEIQSRCAAGKPVSRHEKQLIINFLIREQTPVPFSFVQRIALDGFEFDGLNIKK